MRLRQIRIHTYRQFIDQRLEVLPDVTVLVGRNDCGKTGLMLRLIDQHFFERVVHGSDQSRVPGPAGREISFDTVWEVSAEDYRHFRIAAAFRRDDARTVETQFRQGAANPWQYIVNGDPLRDAYVTEGVTSTPLE